MAAAGELSAGDKAPDFKLATGDGTAISRASFRGQPFVIYFYPKDDTSGCTKEAIDFSAALGKFEKLEITVIGVSKDSLQSHEKFKKKHKLKLTLGSDPDIKTATAFGVWVEKSMYGRKYMGIDRSTFLIDGEGIVRGAWYKVKVPGHVAQVLKAVQAL